MKIKKVINRTSKYITPLGVVFTVILVILTYCQFKKSNNTNKAKFTHKFKTDFFTSQTRDLIILFDNNLLIFDTLPDTSVEYGYYRIDSLRLKLYTKNSLNIFIKSIYNEYEVDDFIINNFDDIGFYEKKGLLDMEYIDNSFGYYIISVYENSAIQQYLKWLRKRPDSEDSFDNFEYIYYKLKKYQCKTRQDLKLKHK